MPGFHYLVQHAQLVGNGVEIFDPNTGELQGFVDLPDGGSVEIIFNREGTLAYVSQMETASVYEIDVFQNISDLRVHP